MGHVALLAASRFAFFALLTNNQVVAWPKSELSEVPKDLTQGFKVMDITAGGSFAAALLQDGTIRIWGRVQGPVPVVPSYLPPMTKIRAASAILFALDTRGVGVVALRRDGRWVTWNTTTGVAWTELESVEPTACFSLGHSHAVGLFEPDHHPSQPVLV
jgi:hypothetical protein